MEKKAPDEERELDPDKPALLEHTPPFQKKSGASPHQCLVGAAEPSPVWALTY